MRRSCGRPLNRFTLVAEDRRAVPEMLTENAHRFAHRRGGSHRAHPAPSQGSGKRWCAFRHRPAGLNDPRSVARRPLPRLPHRTGHRVLRHLKRPAAPECASRTLVERPPQPSGVFEFQAHFCHSAPMEMHNSGPTPRRAKSDFLSVGLRIERSWETQVAQLSSMVRLVVNCTIFTLRRICYVNRGRSPQGI